MEEALTAIAMKDLLEAGVHFGHQTKRWNPKMKAYIFGERNGIYIIDLGKTVKLFREAEEFVTNLAAEGRTILFVGTKRQAQDVDRRRSAALRHVLRQPALARRPAHQLHDHSAQPRPPARPRGDGDRRPLRDAVEEGNRARSRRRSASCRRTSKASATWRGCPTRVFVVDTRKEKIAVDEARKLKIPVIGIVDTNCDPDEVDFVIPGQRRRAARDPAVRVADRRRGHRAAAAMRESAHGRGDAADADERATTRAARRPARRAAAPAATPRRRSVRRAASRRPASRPARLDELAPRFGPALTSPSAAAVLRTDGSSRLRRRRWRSRQNMVKKLRDKTGAGMMECKAALDRSRTATSRRRSTHPAQARASRRPPRRPAARPAKGSIGSYIHMGGKIGVLVEVNCESDFVARTDDFQALVKEIAMHIAAADPQYVAPRGRPGRRAREGEARSTARRSTSSGKPAQRDRQDRRGQARAASTRRSCLLDQPSIRDPERDDRADGRRRPSPRSARTSRSRASSASSSAKRPNSDGRGVERSRVCSARADSTATAGPDTTPHCNSL